VAINLGGSFFYDWLNCWEAVTVATRFKAYFFGHSPAEMVVSNPDRGTDVCYECFVLSGTDFCDDLITRPEESY